MQGLVIRRAKIGRRGSQYASEVYRGLLTDHGLVGSMGRRGNPYDNAKAESFMKTLKVEAVYLMDYETLEDVTADLPRFIRRGLQYSPTPFRARLSQPGPVRGRPRPADGQNCRLACRRREAQSGSCMERENLAGDAKGKSTSGSNREAESTDAPERGGLPCSSDEAG